MNAHTQFVSNKTLWFYSNKSAWNSQFSKYNLIFRVFQVRNYTLRERTKMSQANCTRTHTKRILHIGFLRMHTTFLFLLLLLVNIFDLDLVILLLCYALLCFALPACTHYIDDNALLYICWKDEFFFFFCWSHSRSLSCVDNLLFGLSFTHRVRPSATHAKWTIVNPMFRSIVACSGAYMF